MKHTVLKLLTVSLTAAVLGSSPLSINNNSRRIYKDKTISTTKKSNFGSLIKSDYELLGNKNFNQTVLKIDENTNIDVTAIIELNGNTLTDYFKESKLTNFQNYLETEDATYNHNVMVKNQANLANELLKQGLISKINFNYTNLINGLSVETTVDNLSKIKSFAGVKTTYISFSYNACDYKEQALDKEPIIYSEEESQLEDFYDIQTGIALNNTKYQGQGMVVAVLDSGLDYTHPAFGNLEGVEDTLSKEIVEAKLKSTVAYQDNENGISADDVYYSKKIPFAYDYADNDPDVLPVESDHGTHVSGITLGDDPNADLNKYLGFHNYDTNGYKGVTPKAQLVFMKVFSDEAEQAKSDTIIKALEDCVTLGVDVINESLGSVSGYSVEEIPEESELHLEERLNTIYKTIHDLGISNVCAAGNDYSQTQAAPDGAAVSTNPDYGCVGSPGAYFDTYCVASVGNAEEPTYFAVANDSISFNYYPAFNNSNVETKFLERLYQNIYDVDPDEDGFDKTKDLHLELEYVTVPGLGYESDFQNVDCKGKIALIKRGISKFTEKINNAYDAGAIGAIIYNDQAGIIRMTTENIKIPACSMENAAGELMAAAGHGTIKFDYANKRLESASDFSSIGPNGDLTLKPEIASFGGNVLSGVIGGGYEKFSGTSMACPNVAGLVTALRQYITENWSKFSNNEFNAVELNAITNQLSMSTAYLYQTNVENVPFSPRKQGAGVFNLQACIDSASYLYVKGSEKTKIELKDDKERTGVYEFEFTVKNTSSNDATYKIDDITMTETISHNKVAILTSPYILDPNTTFEVKEGNASISGNEIRVYGKTESTIKVKIVLTDADKEYLKNFKNGIYVEGFVTLTSLDEGIDLNLPFLAFYGNWLDAPLFDKTFFDVQCGEYYDEEDVRASERPHADLTEITMYGQYGEFYMIPLGGYVYTQDIPLDEFGNKDYSKIILAEESKAAISIDEESAIYTLYILRGGMLRGAKKLTATITDANTGEVLLTKNEVNCMKDSYYQSSGDTFPYSIEFKWSAFENQLANNTKYIITVTGEIDYPDGDKVANNTIVQSFYVDYEAPTLSGVKYQKEWDDNIEDYRYYVVLDVYDNRYSMAAIPCIIDENDTNPNYKYSLYPLVTDLPIYCESAGSTTQLRVDLTEYMDKITASATPDLIYFYLEDYAMNSNLYYVSLNGCDFEDLSLKEGIEEIVISPNEVVSINDYVNVDNAMLEGMTWKCSPSTIAKVNKGEIVGVKRGIAVVTGTSSSGVTIKINVKVLGPDDEGYQEIDPARPTDIRFTSYVTDLCYGDEGYRSDLVDEGSLSYNIRDKMKVYSGEEFTLSYTVSPWYVDMSLYNVEIKALNSLVTVNPKTGKVTVGGDSQGEEIIRIGIKEKGAGKANIVTSSLVIDVQPAVLTSNGWLMYLKTTRENFSIDSSYELKYINQYAVSLYDYGIGPDGYITMKAHGNDYIQYLYLPDGIQAIYKSAFEKLSNLKYVEIPATNTELLEAAFKDDGKLETVKIFKSSDNEDIKFTKIERQAFRNCTSLVFTDDDGLDYLSYISTIGSYAFENCRSITKVNISSNRYFGNHQFDGCTSLKEIIMSPESAVGNYMFANCTSLEEVTISTDTIGNNAFENCTSLKKVVFTNPNVKIGKNAFKGCTALTEIEFADGSKVSIGDNAFENTGITQFNIPENSVLTLGAAIFNNSQLKTLHIQQNSTISFSSYSPFVGATLFSRIVCVSDNYFATSDALYTADKTKLILMASTKNVPLTSECVTIGKCAFGGNDVGGSLDLSQITTIEEYALSYSEFTSIKLNSNVTLAEYALYNAKSLKNIEGYAFMSINNHTLNTTSIEQLTFANNAVIGDYALANITTLKKVIFEGNVTIGKHAFEGSFAEKGEVVFNKDATNIVVGEYAFANSKLTTINSEYITSMGDHAFDGNDGITRAIVKVLAPYAFANSSIVKADIIGITEIPEYCFFGAESFTTIETSVLTKLGDYCFSATEIATANISKVTSLGECVFANSKKLMTVTLNSSITKIPDGTFVNNILLKNINLENIVEVGDSGFLGCYSLTEINAPKIEKLGDSAFSGCSAITTISLPACKTIDDLGFFNCRSLTSFDLPIIEYLGNNAFAYCNKLENVNLPSSLLTMCQGAFELCDNLTSFAVDGENSYKNENANWFIKESVLYLINDNGNIQLETYPAKLEATEYVIAEGTYRIQEYAFYGNDFLTVVTMPKSLRVIGDGAFSDCDNITRYIFLSEEAPILEGYYSANLIEYLNTLDPTGEYPGGLNKLYEYSYWVSPYYYNNFFDYVGLNDDLNLTLVCPKDGKNYDTFIYSNFFTNIERTNVSEPQKADILAFIIPFAVCIVATGAMVTIVLVVKNKKKEN